jgi:SAM-dependent methyltransferase
MAALGLVPPEVVHPSQRDAGGAIGPMLVTARPLAEYRAMFALDDADASGRVLDCPGGASSFTAEVCAGGGEAVAVDPVYAYSEGLAELALSEVRRGNRYVVDHPREYVWSFFTDPADHLRRRDAAVGRFAADLAAWPGRYVAGALPDLPFADRSFDLVLSSHLMFSYADRLDARFHLTAIVELVRVCRREARIFPLVGMQARRYPGLPALVGALAARGIGARVSPVRYEFQRGGREMLVCARR